MQMTPLLKSLEIPQAGFRVFWHFNVAMLDALCVPLKMIQERIGHALTGSFTLDVWLVPAIANKYLVEALKRMPAARLPDGSAFPTPEYPLEMILWMSSYTGKTDGDADSWIATVSKLSPEQITVLESSEMMEDNVTILCDGIWRRQYDKPEQERDWATAAERLKAVEAAATSIGFPLLAAAAIRTQIVILAEWEDRLEDAVMLADSALGRFERADCRFLILEVTGRQISYKGQVDRAIPWLEQALECDAFLHSLWRRDVLITLRNSKEPSHPKQPSNSQPVQLKSPTALTRTISPSQKLLRNMGSRSGKPANDCPLSWSLKELWTGSCRQLPKKSFGKEPSFGCLPHWCTSAMSCNTAKPAKVTQSQHRPRS
jgi:hypothetical protein